MTIISIPQILKDKLGESATKALVEVLDIIDQNAHNKTMDIMENRFEKRLIEETGKLRVEMHALRADIIRWMFIFWVGQTATVLAIVKLH